MAKVNVNAITKLQKYLAAIAGDTEAPTPITTMDKLLYNIAEAVGGASESELPEYSATQNGKVLGVVDGALAWVDKA